MNCNFFQGLNSLRDFSFSLFFFGFIHKIPPAINTFPSALHNYQFLLHMKKKRRSPRILPRNAAALRRRAFHWRVSVSVISPLLPSTLPSASMGKDKSLAFSTSIHLPWFVSYFCLGVR